MNYAPFVACVRVLQASSSAPAMVSRERGSAVAILQGALLDLGYKLPKSTAKSGRPDGVFGDETRKAVLQFQANNKLAQDGVAGRATFTRLDAMMVAKKGPPKPMPGPPAPSVPPPLAADRNYHIGTGDPSITPDVGSGVFGSVPTEFSMWALQQAVLEVLPPRGGLARVFIGMDAATNMKHYMDASGTTLNIDLEGMVAAGPTATAHFKNEVRQAQKFVETLAVGRHVITSISAESAYNYKNEGTNWYFAVGGYSTWGKGTATVRNGPFGTEYELNFEYRFYDRYNWDKGKKVEIAGIKVTDNFMGDFHRQGLAREYDMKGSMSRTFSWKKGDRIPDAQYRRGGGR